jgi:hypothetical protein
MDTSTKQDSTDVMLADKAKEIIRLMMTHLPTEGDSEEVSYSYLDAETERNFEIRRFESYKDDGTPYKRFFMSEFVPNGRLCKLNSKGHVVDAWDEPLIKQLEEKFGPNSLMTRLRAADIDPDRMVHPKSHRLYIPISATSISSRFRSRNESSSNFSRHE